MHSWHPSKASTCYKVIRKGKRGEKKKKRRANVSIWGSTGRLQCACSSSTGAHINCTSHNEPSVPSELSFSADRGRLSIEAAFKGGTRARVNSNRGAIVAVVNTKDTCTLFGVFFFFFGLKIWSRIKACAFWVLLWAVKRATHSKTIKLHA